MLAIAVLALIAGGIHLYRVSARNKAEMAQFAGPKIGYHNTLGKTLVIYYSLSGHTKDIADRIALLTDADVYEIKPKEPLKPGILFSLDARRQLKSGNYPKIEENLPDASAYDMILSVRDLVVYGRDTGSGIFENLRLQRPESCSLFHAGQQFRQLF